MVWEFISALVVIANNYLALHIPVISNIMAAVFLVLTETTMNLRVITPILDEMEGLLIGGMPLLPSFITASLFIAWASISIYVYQWIFRWALLKFQPYLLYILIGAFILITLAVNIKYRD